MQVWNVLHAARWNAGRKKSPKNRHLRTIVQLCRAISAQLRHVSTIGKKLVKQQYLLQMSPQYGELRPTSDEIGPVVWAPQLISTALASWLRYCTAVLSSGRQSNFAALNRGRHLCSAGRPSRWALDHILVHPIIQVSNSRVVILTNFIDS